MGKLTPKKEINRDTQAKNDDSYVKVTKTLMLSELGCKQTSTAHIAIVNAATQVYKVNASSTTLTEQCKPAKDAILSVVGYNDGNMEMPSVAYYNQELDAINTKLDGINAQKDQIISKIKQLSKTIDPENLSHEQIAQYKNYTNQLTTLNTQLQSMTKEAEITADNAAKEALAARAAIDMQRGLITEASPTSSSTGPSSGGI